ncbi:MAG: ATP synthase F1 subunit delta [Pseudomonadota bacterium]|jgi:ATP synthase F1 delta subunit|nr:ATP synthase F1 subunit delta [Alphaproteobacteria bacterium]
MRTIEVQLRVSLTGRYANALYKEAIAAKKVDVLLQDVASFQDLLSTHPEVEHAFKNKFLHAKHITTLIEDLGKLKDFSPIFINFLKTVTSKHRGNLLKTILKDFLTLVDIQNDTIPIRVEVASISKKNTTSIEKFLKKNHPKQTCRFEYHEKPELLGGFRAFIYDYCLDYSLKSRLNRLSYQLKEA